MILIKIIIPTVNQKLHKTTTPHPHTNVNAWKISDTSNGLIICI